MRLKPAGLFAETIPRLLLPKSTNRSNIEALQRLRQQDATKQNYGLYGFGKWIHHPKQVETFLSGRIYEVTPTTAEFVPSLECNYSCPECTYKEQKSLTAEERGCRYMDYQLLEHIMGQLQLAGVKGVIYTGGGDPLTYPFLLSAMRLTKALGMEIGLFTNGSLFDKEMIHAVMEEIQPVFIRISMNTPTPQNHALYHGYRQDLGHFERVVANVKYMASLKFERKLPTTLGLGFLVSPRNLDSLLEAGDLFWRVMMNGPRQFGQLDYAAFRPEVLYPRYSGQQRAQHPQDLFDEFMRLFEFHIVPDSQFLPNFRPMAIEERFRDINHPQQQQFRLCTANPWRISISYDGGVHVCTEHNGNPYFRIGDFSTDTFQEIWRGERRREVLWNLNNGAFEHRCPPICVKTYDNKMFWDILALNKRQLDAFFTELAILQKGTHPAHNFF